MKSINRVFEIISVLVILTIIPSIIYISIKEKRNSKELELNKCLDFVEKTKQETLNKNYENELISKLFTSGIDYVYEQSILQCIDKFK